MKIIHKIITSAVLITLSGTAFGQNAPDASTRPAATPDITLPAYTSGIKINYVRSWQPSKAFTTANDVMNSGLVKEVKESTQYLDGLGRPLQSVTKGISPAGKDIVAPVTYDQYGRESYKFMPYEAGTGNGQFKMSPFTEPATFYSTQYPGESIFYGKTDFESSPLNRTIKTMAPGNSWAGSGNGVSQQYLVNTVNDDVRIWDITLDPGAAPVARGTPYAAGLLFKNVTIDEAQHKVEEYKNKEGQVILKKVQVGQTAGVGYDGWLSTYYVYDDLGNLRFVLPPKMVNSLRGNNWVFPNNLEISALCFRYVYDARNRMVLKQVPGADPVYMVYDIRDRLVMTQDGGLRQKGKWLVTFYDELNRPSMTALYATNASTATLQAAMNTSTGSSSVTYNIPAPSTLTVNSHDGRLVYKAVDEIVFNPGFEHADNIAFETELNAAGTIETQTILASNPLPNLDQNQLEPLTYTYYDNYEYEGKKNSSSYTTIQPVLGSPFTDNKAITVQTKGMVTGNKVKLLDGSNTWLTTTTYYDEKGRLKQVLSDNAANGVDVSTNWYDFEGKILATQLEHKNPRSTVSPQMTVLTRMEYDDAGRLLKIAKKAGAGTEVVIADNEYDALGQLKTKSFHRQNTSVLEALNYDYNIRGWLKGINKDYVADNGSGHYFGQELNYDYGFQTNQLNGNIAGIKWKGANQVARSYGFRYDASNRLMDADFKDKSGGAWADNPLVNFDAKMGDGVDHTTAYDANGNIIRMQQWGMTPGGGSSQIDDLRYNYGNNGNKLLGVTDIFNNPSTTLGDFKELIANSQIDYAYDSAGNMISDGNKGISQILYNYLNLPDQINITNKGAINYVYDAAGIKHRKIVNDQTVTPAKISTTDYIAGMIYEDDALKLINHEEGRIRMDFAGSTPTQTYDYFVKDHLGNVRMVLTEHNDQGTYLATMETQQAAKETALFSNIEATRTAKPVGYPQDQGAGANSYVAKLNGSSKDRRIGPSLVLKVMAGDTVSIGARAFYKSIGNKQPKTQTPAADMAVALVQAFGGTAATDAHASAGRSGNSTPFNDDFTGNQYQRLKEKDAGNQPSLNRPKAYLNFALFNDQFKLVEDNSGVRQVQESPDQLQTLAADKIVMKESGFLYVYTSNETAQDVFFDNVAVVLEQGAVLEETHYYPFGLTMSGVSTKAVGPLENRYKYNGIERIGDLGLEDYDAKFRELDPQIGRWWEVDPKTESMEMWSPYVSNYDNPLRYSDFLGDEPGGPGDPIKQVGLVTGREYNLTRPTGFGSAFEFAGQYLSGTLNEFTVGFNQNLNPLYIGVNGTQALATGKDILTGRPMNTGEAALGIASAVPLGKVAGLFGKFASVMEGATARKATQLASQETAQSVIVGSGGDNVLPMNIVREIRKGEKIADVIETAVDRTYAYTAEHAVVKLGANSVAPGARVLVSGGRDGIKFAANEISILYGHTHPYVTGPSAADFNALKLLNQSKQYIVEGFNRIPFVIRKPN